MSQGASFITGTDILMDGETVAGSRSVSRKVGADHTRCVLGSEGCHSKTVAARVPPRSLAP